MRHDKQGTTYTMEEREMSEGNKKKIHTTVYTTVHNIVRKVKNNPTKALLAPALCATYLVLALGIYYNMYMYHIRPRDKAG